ncbi:MAG: transporter substrate-binding domain-containing protein [Gammaproteobacteria bacterium]|nr:transporter substrate-binding domain-containing protein [Gammaproteobacteria bacterium]MBU1554748.1 transporter substrate-binding domain-containing protein [Gammaproteobacteria bacterium]MBU2071814.1 transporter substrate-binding domain-containing protein [Gammaproteobacteria bacterium]MBU2181917.1 transporter substrate-binding domain-containing protein [Gammaproteobacteria bacterium]MBU2205448.1 transporter substrate-binding domain-containing protein [Gammaproteobacteria bacterium]
MRLIILSLLCLILPAQAAELVRYPAVAHVEDPRSIYPLALLEMALARSERQYLLQSSEQPMSKSRSMVFLKENAEVDVLWTMTSVERELDLRPIRIPIFKGLSGYRILLINAAQQANFSRSSAADSIKRLVFAQGHDWVDSKILQLNGFKVVGAAHYDNLFLLLEKSRVDAVPRNALEIADEAIMLSPRKIVIEQNWLLHYPTASYFFVNPANEQLAQDIESGLLQMINDGSFDRLFQQFFASHLSELKLPQRQLIELKNPLLPAHTPIKDRRLWYYP